MNNDSCYLQSLDERPQMISVRLKLLHMDIRSHIKLPTNPKFFFFFNLRLTTILYLCLFHFVDL